MMPGKKKKIVVVAGGPDVPPELLKAIAEQSMEDDGMEAGMGEHKMRYGQEMESGEKDESDDDEDEMEESEESDDILEKELMSVIKKIIETC